LALGVKQPADDSEPPLRVNANATAPTKNAAATVANGNQRRLPLPCAISSNHRPSPPEPQWARSTRVILRATVGVAPPGPMNFRVAVAS
jgi:hypothetical protein